MIGAQICDARSEATTLTIRDRSPSPEPIYFKRRSHRKSTRSRKSHSKSSLEKFHMDNYNPEDVNDVFEESNTSNTRGRPRERVVYHHEGIKNSHSRSKSRSKSRGRSKERTPRHTRRSSRRRSSKRRMA